MVSIPHWLPIRAETIAASNSTKSAAPGLRMMSPPSTPPMSQMPTAIPPRPGVTASAALNQAYPTLFQNRNSRPVATPMTLATTMSTTRHRRVLRGRWVVVSPADVDAAVCTCRALSVRGKRHGK
jgi:hypothetical protein